MVSAWTAGRLFNIDRIERSWGATEGIMNTAPSQKEVTSVMQDESEEKGADSHSAPEEADQR